MIKKIIAFILVMILCAATLAGCGAKIDPNDPNQGLWKATTAEMFGLSMEVTDMFGEGFTIELQDKGKCTLNVDGKKANGTWTLDGSAFTVKGGGVDCQGTLANGTIILDDVLGMGLTLTLEKEGGYAGVVTDSDNDQDEEAIATEEELPASLAWWDGSWYGWMNILESHGDFSEVGGMGGDCYAFIDMKIDGMGTLYLWNDYAEFGTVEIFIDPDEGDGMMGELKALSGTLFSNDVKDGHWFSDPADEDVENLFYIRSDVRTSNDDYARFEIYLRPWGMTWDDMSSVPPGYDSWYMGEGFIDYESMLDALMDSTVVGGNVFIHTGLPAKAYASGGGGIGDPDESGSDTSTPVASGGGAGITTNALINETWEWMDTFEWDDRKTITYDEIASRLGVEGEPIDSDTNADKGAVHFRWKDPNGGVMRIEFRPNADGVYCFAQGNTSGT